jgi:hypothetical protein
MKKLALGLLALLLAGVVYYFAFGSKQLVSVMQQKLDTELTQMKTQGFSVAEASKTDTTQHFSITLDNPEKALPYFRQKGLILTLEELEELNGTKMGADVTYDLSGLSFDLYPLSLPLSFYANTDEKDKKILKQLDAMMTKKVFLVHTEVSHDGTVFHGNMKDINQTLYLEDNITVSILSNHFDFKGALEDNKIKELMQTAESLAVEVDNSAFTFLLQGIHGTYTSTGSTLYDYTSQYTIQTFEIKSSTEGSFLIDGLSMQADSSAKDGLSLETLKAQAKTIQAQDGIDEVQLKDTKLAIKLDNLDISALEKLQTINPDDTKEMEIALQQLISKSATFTLTNFSVDTLTLEKQNLNGFNMDAFLAVDKDLNISTLQANPILGLNSIKTNLNLSLSKALFEKLSVLPDFALVGMLVQPEIKNDVYTYRLELNNGAVLVNGKPIQ